VDPTDHYHRAARAYYPSIGRSTRLTTSNYVFQEAVTWLVYHARRRYVQPLRDLIDATAAIGWLNQIWVTPDIHDAAWRVYEQFADQTFSFTDCSSIAICRDGSIDTAFSFDRHFTIAGLTTVPVV